jgi:hypothetical protein
MSVNSCGISIYLIPFPRFIKSGTEKNYLQMITVVLYCIICRRILGLLVKILFALVSNVNIICLHGKGTHLAPGINLISNEIPFNPRRVCAQKICVN